MELESVYAAYRPLLLSIAYRMLGSVSDAEDLVQDTFVAVRRLQAESGAEHVRNAKSFLCKMVTNRCLDFLKSARKKRELYVGPWLPEPIVQAYPQAGAGHDPLQTVELEDSISYAFLVLLDRLTPVERAVFILREAFDYDYREIAGMLGKTETGCRKIYSRLKRKIQAEQPVGLTDAEHSERLVRRFIQAATTGNMEALIGMLSEDIVVYSDGGGKVQAAVRPIVTPKRAAAFFCGLASKFAAWSDIRLVRVNGQTGLVLSNPADPYPTVVSMELGDDGGFRRIYMVRNPDKLRHLQFG
ncbi:RNA polymerase sigma-70 factor [Cohnella algarum]|uniref:RNA polymerase sigma-70 factor n=1 Tax=Cohnella algarum TaxID=2044859 RepID=UPI001967A889|nr:RNA polymerase sigma-70 factor [Cohnella algarum]